MPLGSMPSAFPVDFERTAIAVAFMNERYIADRVLPRLPVLARKEYRYTSYPLEESYTVPDTRIARRSDATVIHGSGVETTRSAEDYGLEDWLPDDDVANAPMTSDPLDRRAMVLTDLVMLDRERRVAKLVFDAASYGAASKTALSGTSRWSSSSSTPISDIEGAIAAMIVPPNRLVMGRAVWTSLRAHAHIVSAVQGNDGERGLATRQQVADLFELDEVLVGEGWNNTANAGQDASLGRVWGKSALLFHATDMPDPMGPPSLGFTAPYRGREVYTGFDERRGARGMHYIRVVDSCDEVIVSDRCGYLFSTAVA